VASLTRRRPLPITQGDDSRLPRIQALTAEQPFWGYRRLWAHLHGVEQLLLKKKRGLREHHLLVKPTVQLRAKRAPSRSQPKATQPHEWGGIDLTQGWVEGCGWVSIVLSLEWSTKKVGGDDAGLPCTARPWLAALDMAVPRQCPDGAQGKGVALMRDNGGQPAAMTFMKACSTLGIHQT
jgi:putative transposase